MKCRAVGGHPSKKTFQAIRIELNSELDVLINSIDSMIEHLNDQRTFLHYYIPFVRRPDCKGAV